MAKYTNYQNKFTYIERVQKSNKLLQEFPNNVPVIIERYPRETLLPRIQNRQFLVPKEVTVAYLINILKSRLGRYSRHSIWLYAGNTVLQCRFSTIAEIYNKYRSLDGFLYLQYSGEETFG